MMASVLIALAVMIAVVVTLVAVRGRPRPSRMARAHLDAQIAKLRAEISALQFSDNELIAHQEAAIREHWLRNEMTTRDVASLDVPGLAEGMFDVLREHGIAKLADVERLRARKVPGIGSKRAAQLWSVYQAECKKLRDAASGLDRETLDQLSGGKLGALVETHRAEELQRERDLESAEVRLADLERRRSTV